MTNQPPCQVRADIGAGRTVKLHRFAKMDNNHVCSRCKKVAIRARGTSIHKTLAYTRCRCHRFSKTNQESMAQVSSVLINIPEPKPDSYTNVRSVLCTTSHFISPSIHRDSQRQSVHTTSRSDRQITLPRIFERPSLVADFPPVVVATDINGYSNLETQGSQVNAPSATALETSSLPKLLPQSRCTFNYSRWSLIIIIPMSLRGGRGW